MWDLFVPFVINGPGAQLDPGSVDFGTAEVGSTSSVRTIEFVNIGNANTTLGTILSSNPEFAIVGGTCANGAVLAPTNRCTIQLTFTPLSAGGRSGSLTVNSDADNGTVNAALSGE
jgi:hypothetical protein